MTADSTTARERLRTQLRAARVQLNAVARIAAADALMSTLEQLPEFLVDTRVAGYWAIGGEMSLHAAFARLRRRQQTYCLPIIEAARQLSFAAWEPGQSLRANRFGIPEPDVDAKQRLHPQAIDLVLVPLLGFDRRGHRLGAGGGYYDRSFAFLGDCARPAQPLLVGIGYHFQELPELTPETWDVALDFIATDRELIACTESPA